MKHAYAFLLLMFFANCLTAQTFQFYENGRRPALKQEQTGETGMAIYYADYLHGEPTSLGEVYDMNKMSCAHNTHPLGTMLKITRIDNGASVTVRVTDRGPRAEGCIVLLSKAAAIQMDMLKLGKVRVRSEVVGYSDQTPGIPVAASRYDNEQPRSYDSGLTAKGFDDRNSSLTSTGTRSNSSNYTSRQQPAAYQNTQYAQTEVVAKTPQRQVQTNNLTAKGVAGGQYIIQFGSYRDYDNASRHADSLRRQGASGAVVREMNTPNGLFYKVTSATFSDKTSAQQELDGLRNNNISDGIVVTLK
ncbi:MAG: septal ring lytic transglycosylase RlpA family protein [Saprospiraceae bacterium]|nr:septal ring lytic transglycosylase RlpA family protein [Saprospiraceae bacterium]